MSTEIINTTAPVLRLEQLRPKFFKSVERITKKHHKQVNEESKQLKKNEKLAVREAAAAQKEAKLAAKQEKLLAREQAAAAKEAKLEIGRAHV